MRKRILSVTLILNGKELNDDYWFIRHKLHIRYYTHIWKCRATKWFSSNRIFKERSREMTEQEFDNIEWQSIAHFTGDVNEKINYFSKDYYGYKY